MSNSVWIDRKFDLCFPMVATLHSYPAVFIFMFVTALTRSFEFSSFSLANIAFGFSLCVMKARLNISAVKLLASFITPSSSYLMTCNISSLIFTLDNGVFFSHCNRLWYYKILHNTYTSNFPCTLVHRWHQVCSKKHLPHSNSLKHFGTLMT